MRLLTYDENDQIRLTDDLHGDQIPRRYAVLSHTWTSDELTFQDLARGDAEKKAGYEKVRFCGQQARRDGIDHFWVDTCCIDKTSSAELNEVINSMFRWYQQAEKCYVYLSDVPPLEAPRTGECAESDWQADFRNSRWFTRGWTLQELLAPTSVEFFDSKGKKLGDKSSLERQICDITHIPASALRTTSFSSFSREERFSWQSPRQTTRAEDITYALLGIFDISMPIIYGEGRDQARRRLVVEIEHATKGTHCDSFAIPFSLSEVVQTGHFVARQRELSDIRTALTSDGARRICALHGLGGIGKTQLACAYAVRYSSDYSAILWMNINDEASLKQSFTKAINQISNAQRKLTKIGSTSSADRDDDAVEAVKAWLSIPRNTRWLLIFDNYDNPKVRGNSDPNAVDISKYLPQAHQGHVLITTRSSQVYPDHSIPIRKLDDLRDSLKILSLASKRDALSDDPSAVELAEHLDGLPLALATAGAYLRQSSISFSRYLELYNQSWAKLQKTSPEVTTYTDRTLYSTWQITYDQIRERSPISANLLRLWAYFDHRDVWYELLSTGKGCEWFDDDVPDWFRELVEDELRFHESVRVLCEHGIVEPNLHDAFEFDSSGYSIHSCVHSWTKTVLNADEDATLAAIALQTVAQHSPYADEKHEFEKDRRLLSHAFRICDVYEHNSNVAADLAWAFKWLGYIFKGQRRLREAEYVFQVALKGYEASDPDRQLPNVITRLGEVYRDRGKLESAEKMHKRALDGFEQAEDHEGTFGVFNDLGNVYKDQGRLAEAERMFERALRGYESIGEASDNTLNSIIAVYKNQGKLNEAEALYRRALQGNIDRFEANHVSTLTVLDNLGQLYGGKGKLDEAQRILEKALEGRAKMLGEDHASTLGTLNSLGNLCRQQGRLGKAEEMLQRALRGRIKVRGPEHPDTLLTYYDLGILYGDQGRLNEAEQMYQTTLQGELKVLGPDHAYTLLTMNKLHWVYSQMRRCDKQMEMAQRVLQGRMKTLGPEHPDTLKSYWQLGHAYADSCDHQEAEAMHQRALQGRLKVLGPEHDATLISIEAMGLLYRSIGKLDEAEELLQRALQVRLKLSGSDHMDTVFSKGYLGWLHAMQGRFEEAESMYQQASLGYEKVHGADHEKTTGAAGKVLLLRGRRTNDQCMIDAADALFQRSIQRYKTQRGSADEMDDVGRFCFYVGVLDKAEKWHQRALAGYKNIFGSEHRRTLDTTYGLGEVYVKLERLDEAEQMFQRALSGYEVWWGHEHSETLDAAAVLGEVYLLQSRRDGDKMKLDQAQALYQRALKGYDRMPPRLQTNLDRLGELLRANGVGRGGTSAGAGVDEDETDGVLAADITSIAIEDDQHTSQSQAEMQLLWERQSSQWM